jgi:hypothetical protein
VYQRRWFVAVLLLAGLAVPAFGQDPVTLSWKFEAGKAFYQEMTTSTKQSMKVMGQEVNQNQNQTFFFSWTPKEQDKDKNWIVIQKIEAVKMDIEIAGQKIPYDSTKDQASTGNPLAEFFKALVGSEFKLTISPEMKVIKIEGRDEFINKLVKANPQMEPLLKQILGDDALKQMSDASFRVIPSPPKALKKGESWTPEKQILNMGPIGSYETTAKFTYEGLDDKKLSKIKVETSLNYTPPGANAAATLPFKIKAEGTKLTSKNATGTIFFDNEKHRLDHSTQTLKLEGTLKIDIGGMTSDVELTQDQTTTVTTTDTNPIAPPKKP